jgi:preprotein translocase subunit SecG
MPEDWPTPRTLACKRRYAWPVEAIFSIIQVFIAVGLIFLVLMHSGKDSGLSGAFGVGSGQGPLGGGSMVERNLNRWTVGFAILFTLNTIILLKKPW